MESIIGTVVVATALVIMVVLAVITMIKNKKSGKSIQCGGDCKHCGGRCS